jgi:predicted nucleotidyltransferase
MATMREIRRVAKGISQRFRPAKIILFGSYGYGVPTEDSDVDLLVVVEGKGDSMQKQLEITQAVDAPFSMDLLVRSRGEIARRIAMDDFFCVRL